MTKKMEHVEAARQEAIRLGATFTLENGKHLAGIIAINGKSRKAFISRTPSDRLVCHKVKITVRRLIREMTDGTQRADS